MFNCSWGLRNQTEFLSPKGPSFDRAPWKELYLSGTHIKIKVPRHRTQLPAIKSDTDGPHRIEDLDDGLYERNGIRFRAAAVITRWWDFYGSWFTGRLGSVALFCEVISPAEPLEGLNYFNPRALEAGVADYLTARYGNEFSPSTNQQLWLAPMNWRQCHNFPCVAARFDVVHSIAAHFGPDCFLVFPLTKKHFLKITCKISRNIVFSDKQPKPSIDEWIDPKPFLALANQVLDSVQIELSPQAKADQEEALRNLEEKTLIKEYPPIKWEAPQVEVDNSWYNP